MYTHTSKPAQSDKRVEIVACYGLVASAIVYGLCRFWNLSVPTGVLLSPPFVCLSFLLSRVALRLEEAVRKEAWVTFAAVTVMGLFCLLFESSMTHLGLDWLNGREHFAPGWAMWPASLALSAFNVGSIYAFARSIDELKPAATPATKRSADVVPIFGSHQERRTLQEIGAKLRAEGAM